MLAPVCRLNDLWRVETHEKVGLKVHSHQQQCVPQKEGGVKAFVKQGVVNCAD